MLTEGLIALAIEDWETCSLRRLENDDDDGYHRFDVKPTG
jgi:hypothetical protein